MSLLGDLSQDIDTYLGIVFIYSIVFLFRLSIYTFHIYIYYLIDKNMI